jgi:hypothetical protein
MRQILVAVMFIVLAQGASAQSNLAKTDPMGAPDVGGNAEADVAMRLREFKNQMEAAGFREVQISPTLLLQAKDKDDQPVTMLIDPQRMIGIQLKGSPENETTGSGQIDDLKKE